MGYRNQATGTSEGPGIAVLQGVPGKRGHHPLPLRAHTYSGPDSVCGSEAGGLWKEGGGGRRKAGRECPGAWLGRRVGAAVAGGTRVPSPLTHPCRRVGRQPAPFPPFPGLPPAPCQRSASGQSCSRARSQPACRQEAAPPQLHLPLTSLCPRHPQENRHLGSLALCTSPPFIHAPHSATPTSFCATLCPSYSHSICAPTLETHLWALDLHAPLLCICNLHTSSSAHNALGPTQPR